MLRNFNWVSNGNYHSQQSGDYEVTVQRTSEGHLVSLWKSDSKNLVEEQNFAGTDLNTLLRSLALADQLLKQNKKS